MKPVDDAMLQPLQPERFLVGVDLTGIEQVFDGSMIVVIVTMMCMDVTVVVVDENNIAVLLAVERLVMVAHIVNFCLSICYRMFGQSKSGIKETFLSSFYINKICRANSKRGTF